MLDTVLTVTSKGDVSTTPFDIAPYESSSPVLTWVLLGSLASFFIVLVLLHVFKVNDGSVAFDACFVILALSLIISTITAAVMFLKDFSYSSESLNAAQKHFGIIKVDDFYLPTTESKPLTFKNVTARPEGVADYTVYDYVIVKMDEDGKFIADFVKDAK